MGTLSSALMRAASRFAERPAVLTKQGTQTWAQFLEVVKRGAGCLAETGVQRGDRVATLAVNSPAHTEFLFACIWLGAVPVPVNFRLAAPEIDEVLAAANVSVIAGDGNLDRLLPALSKAQELPVIHFDAEVGGSWCDGSHEHPGVCAEPDELAIIYFTSGTRGSPKGVPLTHDQVIANALQVAMYWPRDAQSICLHVAPMFHSADLLMQSSMFYGAANAYLDTFTPAGFCRAVEEFGVTHTMLVPAMIGMLLRSKNTLERDLKSLRQLIYGASPMAQKTLEEFHRLMPGLSLAQGYGLTETSPLLSILDNDAHIAALDGSQPQLFASCGQALVGVDIRIVDENGQELLPGLAGEIQARGPNVFDGYLGEAAESFEVFDGSWFRTSDFGYRDAEGYLYVLDRKADIINRGGEKIRPREIETLLDEHPQVVESAVVGIPGRGANEVVLAVLVTEGSVPLTASELRDFCAGRIAAYKIPRRVRCVEALPRTTTGKVQKARIVEMFGSGR